MAWPRVAWPAVLHRQKTGSSILPYSKMPILGIAAVDANGDISPNVLSNLDAVRLAVLM